FSLASSSLRRTTMLDPRATGKAKRSLALLDQEQARARSTVRPIVGEGAPRLNEPRSFHARAEPPLGGRCSDLGAMNRRSRPRPFPARLWAGVRISIMARSRVR